MALITIWHNHMTSIIPLLVVIIMIIIITANTEIITYYAINSSHSAYAHNFVPALAATFLTKINQIRVQTQLVENDIPLNLSLAKQHAEIASELFDNNTQNDLYYNAEGNNGLAKMISDDIPLALSNLQKAVRTISTAASNQSEQSQQTTTSSSVIKEIKQMVNNINYILDKAIHVRIGTSDLTNSTVHALVLAGITEKAYNDYSYAFGIKPIIFSGSSSSSSSSMMMNMGSGMEMGTMMMSSSPNSSSSTNSSAKNDLLMTKDNNDNSTVVNTTAYQQAQGLAMRAQQIFNNDLKPTSSVNGPSSSSSTNSSPSSTNTTITTAITKIENSLIHLKNAIDGKAPTMDVMKIVHGDIHPTLLISYKLQLKGANNDNNNDNNDNYD
jgi:hypothetical protein